MKSILSLSAVAAAVASTDLQSNGDKSILFKFDNPNSSPVPVDVAVDEDTNIAQFQSNSINLRRRIPGQGQLKRSSNPPQAARRQLPVPRKNVALSQQNRLPAPRQNVALSQQNRLPPPSKTVALSQQNRLRTPPAAPPQGRAPARVATRSNNMGDFRLRSAVQQQSNRATATASRNQNNAVQQVGLGTDLWNRFQTTTIGMRVAQFFRSHQALNQLEAAMAAVTFVATLIEFCGTFKLDFKIL